MKKMNNMFLQNVKSLNAQNIHFKYKYDYKTNIEITEFHV